MSQVPVIAETKNNAEIEKIMESVEQIKTNISSINSTFANKLQWLYDDQTKDHKIVDSLSETGQNISARVTTLEGICNKLTSDETTFQKDVDDLSKEVS